MEEKTYKVETINWTKQLTVKEMINCIKSLVQENSDTLSSFKKISETCLENEKEIEKTKDVMQNQYEENTKKIKKLELNNKRLLNINNSLLSVINTMKNIDREI